MQHKMVGLIGAGKGPRICVGHEATSVMARIRGLMTGRVLVRHLPRGSQEVVEDVVDAEMEPHYILLERTPAWVEFENLGSSRVVCTVEHV